MRVAVQEVEKLHTLIEEADVVFLLTDSRESRWLPTLQATATDTLLINAALAFDSWLTMRHGMRAPVECPVVGDTASQTQPAAATQGMNC